MTGDRLPENLRRYHSRPAVELLADTKWETDRRAEALRRFVADEAWLWSSQPESGRLEASRFLEFMKAPTPDNVVRYFRYWEIEDIFTRIARQAHVRAELRGNLMALVSKRNNIAHGNVGVTAEFREVQTYLRVVRTFCERTDRALARHLARRFGVPDAW